ncbi:MAG: MarR family winged helix-turn-helix transcriptional regulator [Thermomicrobiales bacterium]
METRIDPSRSSIATIEPSTIAWLRLARIYHKIDRRTAETMRQYDLSVSRFDVLNHAGTPEGRTQGDLANALLVTKGNVTQLLDAMEREGLLERRRDGRTKRVYLTEKGRCRRANVVAIQEAEIATDLSALDDEETQTLIRLLRKVDQSLKGPV